MCEIQGWIEYSRVLAEVGPIVGAAFQAVNGLNFVNPLALGNLEMSENRHNFN